MSESRSDGCVFMITAANPQNGTPRIAPYLTAQMDALKSLGWQVRLGIVDSRTSPSGVVRNVRRLKREIAEAHPAVVHVEYGSVTAAVANIARGKFPFVISFRGSDLLGRHVPTLRARIRDRIARHLGFWAAARADAVIVMSQNLMDELPGRIRTKAVILPHGVDMDVFRPADQAEARGQLQWASNEKIILFNTSLNDSVRIKNPGLAQEAVAVLGRSIPNVRLHMIAGAARHEVVRMMNAADCLLVTSLHEGSPNIVKEAMACNLPVVTVPCGDVVERLQDVRPGAVRPYNAEALAKAMEEVLQSGDRSNGRERLIAQGQTADGIARRLIAVYQCVLRSGSRS